jgi:hypothetical protein
MTTLRFLGVPAGGRDEICFFPLVGAGGVRVLLALGKMMVREPMVVETKDHQSLHHHHYPGLAVKGDPQEL